ncbi:uncharacterized protein DUF1826 [Novosphingobium sp. PhB55]|uniref:DUF1826 domain-containing protein n=1 Tax=Novosphingobium sp. PhB55 TaxID=2485106 RepID=UPI001066335E|nr:DUF1826 domain-containing protein [Novosphingobium sp. PhB55]TDW67281.1 uncharacterized protein DUF1826 [Novosphingobium sp. PhB55]
MKKERERPDACTALSLGPDAEALHDIACGDVDLAIWTRALGTSLAQEVETLDLDRADDVLLTCLADQAAAALAPRLVESGHAPCPALLADVALLARLHAGVAGKPGVTIRLEVVETDACRKFHADYVTLRTITTYRGVGTQWKRVDHERIHALKAGEVGVFKGRLLREQPSILHRSPPIADSGETRLVLVIDSNPSR